MKEDSKSGVRTWLEIDTEALKKNCETFRSLIPAGCKLCGVVKSNAYGHGLVGFSQELEKIGVDWLVVDSVVEALRLRKEGIKKPILVLGFTLPEMIEEAISNDISITVSHTYILNILAARKSGGKAKVHIKVDSGMNRQGFSEKYLDEVLETLGKNKDKIEVEGIYTHFAAAKNPAFPQESLKQIEIFKKWLEAFRSAGFSPIAHASATSGTILFPQAHFDMVRIGIGLYGYWPSKETMAFAKDKIKLLPVLSWRTLIGEVKDVPKGAGVGYDFTEKVSRDSRIAICPIGYWHGFPRALSCIAEVLVRGKRVKILGRVSMDMIIIDVTGVPDADILDEVTLLGKDGKEFISADEMGALADTTCYEILTRINPLIRKIYK